MALSIKSVRFHDLSGAGRFDARYFFLQEMIEQFSEDQKIQLMELGEKDLILEITDGEHAGQTFLEQGIRFIKNSSVKDFDISVTDGFFISRQKHSLLGRSAVKRGDILFTTIGHLGSAAVVPKGFGEANINQNLVRIKVNENLIDPYYLAAFLNSSFVRRQIDCLFTGNIQRILTYPKIKKIKIIKAAEEFQKRIRKWYLEAIEYGNAGLENIEEAQRLIRQQLRLDEFQANESSAYEVNCRLMKHTLWTPRYYYPRYVSAVEYFLEHFPCRRLSQLVSFRSGDEVGSDAYNSYLDRKRTDVPFIRTSDIYNYQYDICPDFFVDQSVFQELNQDIQPGDILFSNDGKIGMIAMVSRRDPIVAQSHIQIMRLESDEITPEYLYAMLMIREINTYQSEKCTVVQSTIPTLAKRLNAFVIPILEKEARDQITELIRRANDLFDQKRDRIRDMQSAIEELLHREAESK